ncbi:MAG: DUF2974 domain-containing protein [Pseudobutyrivibrio sp.]|uniref:Mbeg1-like protein n=1 Tax=Pseudobutyrivibrio sp. TaxID=2014367 RepID=UPI0025FF691C|nr:Mbeg1-like protein [Pseudobutyrivibrio sp.]MBQ8488650.1 DUF2974 domain-containing protein [Pseudobutyrivibrio sp.]
MDNISDYLRWYGEFSFDEKPLTEVDNFILCKLTYLILTDIKITSPRKFRDVVAEVKSKSGIQGTFYGKEFIVDLAAESKRFGDIYLSRHVDVLDEALSAQFAAMTFDLTDELRFISYRGTDDTMAGWKEDFMISFTETEAQKKALAYLKDAIDGNHKLIVAGHSKGANLALYAATHLEDELQDNVSFVYMNDGPGLCPEVCDKTCVSKIKDKALRFIPEYSIFGKLFEETEIPLKIVKSTEEGVMQHDLFTWGVDHGLPLLSDSNHPGSVFINQVLDQWIESCNDEKRISFVNNLFNSIDKAGIKTTTQVVQKGPFAIEKILIELLSLDKNTVRTFMKLPVTAALDKAPDSEKANKIKQKIQAKEWLPYVCMLFTSIILFIIPEYILQAGISLALLAVIVFEIIVTIRHLIKAKWNLQEESARVYICLVMLGVYAMLLVKEDALFLIGSVVIGVSFLAWAYRNAITFRNLCNETDKKERRPEKVKLVFEIVFLIILAGFILIAPKDTLAWYMVFLGVVLLIDSIVNLGMIFHRCYTSKRTI